MGIWHSTFAELSILLLLLILSESADDPCIKSPSSCGSISKITYPFRLTIDPSTCGDHFFEITCESNVPTLLYNSSKFFIRSINYNNYTIRLSDASFIPNLSNQTFLCNSSSSLNADYDIINSLLIPNYLVLPDKSPLWDNELFWIISLFSCSSQLRGSSFSSYENHRVCENDVYNQSRKTQASDAGNSYWYATLRLHSNELGDSCRVEARFRTSLASLKKKRKPFSFKDIYDAVEYGFELSWFSSACLSDNSPCFYLTNITTDQYIAVLTNSEPKNLFRSFLKGLAKTPIGLLLDKINWNPPLYYALRNFGYFVALCRYILALYILHEAPLLCIILPLLIALVVLKWRKRHLSIYDDVEEFLEKFGALMPVRYSYSNIKSITDNFKMKIGEGGYGSVYKGKLRSGVDVAVKITKNAKAIDGTDFVNEVATVGRARHANVVRLVGFCAERYKRALVYEFMPKGSLDRYIEGGKQETHISDRKMFEIALGIARGIDYLHRGCAMQILHFDIKPHNILLDRSFNPKISDFGLAKLHQTDKSMASLTAARGTLGYMAPELFYKGIGRPSHKADVYSYGRMLMEMATRKSGSTAARGSDEMFLPSWVHDHLSNGEDINVGRFEGADKGITRKMMAVGLWCVQMNPTDRPPMHRVIEMLRGDVDAIGLPPKPSFAPPRLAAEGPSSTFTATSQFTGDTTSEDLNISV